MKNTYKFDGEIGETRYVKKFAWWPINIANHWVWFKHYEIGYVYDMPYSIKCLYGLPTHSMSIVEYLNTSNFYKKYPDEVERRLMKKVYYNHSRWIKQAYIYPNNNRHLIQPQVRF